MSGRPAPGAPPLPAGAVDGGGAAAAGDAAPGERSGARRPRFGLLLLAASSLFVVGGAVTPSTVQQVVVTALSGSCLLLALRAARYSASVQRLAVAIAVVAVGASVARALGAGIGAGAARMMNTALLLLGPPAVAVGVIRDLRSTRVVGLQSIMGVLSLYLLVGLLYAGIYGTLDDFGSGPFFAEGQTATVAHCLYFSFTTLATVGYGDYVAQSNLGHTLSVSEALVGQIYLVTVVSLLISNLGGPPRQRRG